MPLYNDFLKLCGYRGLINKSKNEIVHNITINDDIIHNSVRHLSVNWYEVDKYRYAINYTYITFIVLLLLWFPIYAIIVAIINKDIRILTSHFSSILFLVQFVLGLKYYQTQHFDKTYSSREIKDEYKIEHFYTGSIILAIISTVVDIILIVLELRTSLYTKMYNELGTISKVFIIILLGLNKMYAYITFFVNIINFSFIFIDHSDKAIKFGQKLDIKVNNLENLNINTIITDYQELKNNHCESVEKWNDSFSSLTLMGIIVLYFVSINYGSKYADYIEYLNCVYFVIADVIYLLTINKVKNGVKTIMSIINTPKFINNYKTNSTMDDINDPMYSIDDIESAKPISDKNNDVLKYVKTMIFRVMIKSHENNFANEWQILNSKLHQEWENFSIFGFELKDSSLAKKAVALLTAFFMASHLRSTLEI